MEIIDFRNVQYKDGAVLENNYFAYFEHLRGAQQQLDQDIDAIQNVPAELERAGFIEFRHEVSEMPIGDWPEEESLREIGLKFKDKATADVRETRAGFIKHENHDALTVCSSAEYCLEYSEGTYFPLYTFIARKPLANTEVKT